MRPLWNNVLLSVISLLKSSYSAARFPVAESDQRWVTVSDIGQMAMNPFFSGSPLLRAAVMYMGRSSTGRSLLKKEKSGRGNMKRLDPWRPFTGVLHVTKNMQAEDVSSRILQAINIGWPEEMIRDHFQ